MVAIVASFAGLASLADATPVTYNFTGGAADVSASWFDTTLGVTETVMASFALTGAQATFDPTNSGGPAVTAFNFQDTGPAVLVNLVGSVLGGQSISFSDLILSYADTGNLSNASGGPTAYTFSANPSAFSASASLSGGKSAMYNYADTTLTGQIQPTYDSITMTGIDLGTISVKGTTVTLKGDIEFNGTAPVPLPASALLLASALGFGALPLIRRRRAA